MQELIAEMVNRSGHESANGNAALEEVVQRFGWRWEGAPNKEQKDLHQIYQDQHDQEQDEEDYEMDHEEGEGDEKVCVSLVHVGYILVR
jgi:hypothetical protein